MAGLHTLYRFFDAGGNLLYVGITCNPGRRMDRHRTDKAWWSEIVRVEMEQYSTREALAAAERVAITSEKPQYNIRMNGDGAPPRSRALPCGLEIDKAYALGLDDGTCPVGIVIAGDEDGVVLTLFNWIVGMFDSSDEWVSADAIVRWRRAELLSSSDAHADGWAHDAKVYAMDPLASFQTQWERHVRDVDLVAR